MDNDSIKDNICKFRKQMKMTQEEMADLLNISLTAYRDLEKGSTMVVSQHVINMAKLTGRTSEEIVLGYKPSQTDNPEEIKEAVSGYSNRIEELERRLKELERTIFYMDEALKSKDEVIAMLRRRIPEEK